MSKDFEQHVAWKAYCEMMQLLVWGVPAHQSEADLPQADDIGITDIAPVMRAAGGDVCWLRWASGFRLPHRAAALCFEFKGSKSPKTKHRFTLKDVLFMAVAGIWRDQQGNQPPAFAMLTMAPGPDVEPIHNRQIAVLQPQNWKAWVCLTRSEAELLRPLPAGSLSAETVRVGALARRFRLAAALTVG